MKYIRHIMLYANIIVIIGMMLTGYSGYINPERYHLLSVLGYAFPAFLFANMTFLVVWVLCHLRYVIVPLLGFLLAYSPVRSYFPVNISKEVPEGAIKVLSFNVYGFKDQEERPKAILEYIIHSDADIVCAQEFTQVWRHDSLLHILDSIYQYRDTLNSRGYRFPKGDVVAVMSKFPIVGKEAIPIRTAGNTLGVFKLDIDGDTVHVINAHLETVGLSEAEKSEFSEMMHGKKERNDVKQNSKFFAHKIADATAIRAPQADAINEYVRRHPGASIILCGDFNDHPLSYVHHTAADRLTDCYRATGMGPGFTFHYHSMYFRIDHIMCSDNWQPYNCVVDKSIDKSDHYPIYCYLHSKKTRE